LPLNNAGDQQAFGDWRGTSLESAHFSGIRAFPPGALRRGNSPVQTYRLIFTDPDGASIKSIEFTAPDAALALIMAHEEARDRPAELWLSNSRLCTIRRQTADLPRSWSA